MKKLYSSLLLLAATADAWAAAPSFTGMMGPISFGTIITALLYIMGGLAGVFVVSLGGHLILEKLTPAKDTRIEYEGQKWDADVFYAAMKDIEAQRKSGVLLDRDSYRALSNWKRGR